MELQLKKEEEIIPLIDKEKVLLISCKTCFQEYKPNDNSQITNNFKNLLSKYNISIDKHIEITFLCNELLTHKQLAALEFIESTSVCVIACGIGFQTISKFFKTPPVQLVDTVDHEDGYLGIALTEVRCFACGECLLNYTGGICPVVNCSKGLLNGPCGGTNNGYCEIKKNGEKKLCAWEKIYEKLRMFNDFQKFTSADIKIRNYSKIKPREIDEIKTKIKIRRQKSFYGGVYPDDMKYLTEEKEIQKFKDAELLYIPLLQHAGKACSPLVEIGGYVKLGQKIADSHEKISSPIHASVSGYVKEIKEMLHPTLLIEVPTIVIENDGKNIFDETIKPNDYESLSPKEIIEIIREKGVVGLGGAMFPTHIKLSPPKPVDVLLINGCECEPYLTSDYRVMLEMLDGVLIGMEIMMKSLGVKKSIIAIESNKPNAIKLISQKIKNQNKFEIVELPTKYPQGAERMLIKKVLNRKVPLGGLPYEVGVVVHNISTAYAVYDAIVNGMPLIERIVTISGDDLNVYGNFKIKIGVSINVILECFAPNIDFNLYDVKVGGPMMGIIQPIITTPVIKGTTGITVKRKQDILQDTSKYCIKCGRCVDVCPMELYPCDLYFYITNGQFNKISLEVESPLNVFNCIECGCCDYICSNKLPIVKTIKAAKQKLKI